MRAAMVRLSRFVAAPLFSLALLVACTNTAPHTDPPALAPVPMASSSSGSNTANTGAPDASTPLDGSIPDAANDTIDAAPDGDTLDGGPNNATAEKPPRPFVRDNKVLPPLESDELTQRAKKLFDAIAQDDPALGESFWFPKEPFIPLKDVKGPDKYWDNLHKTYERDIHALHRKRKSWEGATFVSFKMGSTPKWVPPGDEANKIGYYRSFRGKLTYRVDGKDVTFDVHTIISWQGEWFITHLSKFKKK